jgi:hypothetical protein
MNPALQPLQGEYLRQTFAQAGRGGSHIASIQISI